MKFGRTLEEKVHEEWKEHAVDYKAMKRVLPKSPIPSGSVADDHMLETFWEIYQESVQAVEKFYKVKVRSATEELDSLRKKVERMRLARQPGVTLSSVPLDAMKAKLVEFKNELDLVMEFLTLNRTAFRKILKKFDKRTYSNVQIEKMNALMNTHSYLDGGGLVSDILYKLDSMIKQVDNFEEKSETKIGHQAPKRLTREERLLQAVLEKAQSVMEGIEHSPFFTTHKAKRNPTFTRKEIQAGDFLGEGEFGTVHEIKSFLIKDTCPICLIHQTGSSDSVDGNSSKGSQVTQEIEVEDGFKMTLRNKCRLSEDDIHEFECDHVEQDQEVESNRGFMRHHCFRQGSARYAIKELRRPLDVRKCADGAIDMAIEAKFLSVLSHPNIIKLCGTSNVPPGHPETFIILDRLYGTLGSKIQSWKEDEKKLTKGLFMQKKKHKKELEWMFNERLLAAYDIARAMKYLHSNDIMYRDLKPENCGFDVRGQVKVFDFGLAKELVSKDKVGKDLYNVSGRTGTRRYMSPEVTLCKPYGKPADVYSFAILMWETLTLSVPFEGYGYEKHAKLVVQKGSRPDIPKDWPTLIKGIVEEAWAPMPSNRPTLDRLCGVLQGELAPRLSGIDISDRTIKLMDTSFSSRPILTSHGISQE